MKNVAFYIAMFWIGSIANAQRFKPYHSFGFAVSFVTSNVDQDKQLLADGFPLYGPLTESINTIDVYGHYDFGIKRWLGLNSGIGLICRGGENEETFTGPLANIPQDKRLMFYASVPLILQIKPFKSFWLEGGLVSNFYLFKIDDGYFVDDDGQPTPSHFSKESIKPVVLNWQAGFRVNLYRGLSISAGYYSSITPIAQEVSTYDPTYVSTFHNYGFHLGLRYMFKQTLR